MTDAPSNALATPTAAPARLAWTRPVVRELTGAEARWRRDEILIADLKAQAAEIEAQIAAAMRQSAKEPVMNMSVIRPKKSALVAIDDIDCPTNARPHHADKVSALAKSIRLLGLQSPPTVVEREGRYKLVAGRHRLEALRVIGVDQVPVHIANFDDLEARLWTISENLHRNELSALERAEQIGEWIRLMAERDSAQRASKPEAAEEMRQLDAKPQGGRPEGGVRAAARELRLTEPDARRSVKIDSIAPAAKEAAREAGLDRNQSALLKVASYTDKDQVQAVAEMAKAKSEKAPADRGPVRLPVKPLRSLENLAAGELARWIKLTTPNDRLHVIRVLEDAAAILRGELEGIAVGPRRSLRNATSTAPRPASSRLAV
jgi:ParB/RepB/Spo0J family partition protein